MLRVQQCNYTVVYNASEFHSFTHIELSFKCTSTKLLIKSARFPKIVHISLTITLSKIGLCHRNFSKKNIELFPNLQYMLTKTLRFDAIQISNNKTGLTGKLHHVFVHLK